MMRAVFLLLSAAWLLNAQPASYKGPKPPKPDLPYLLHAENLVETESLEAREEPRKNKDEILYVINGAGSSAKTPLASPIFLMRGDKLRPDQLELYKLDVKNGRREILFQKKQKQTARPIRLSFSKLDREGLYRVEVDESLENGEYSLTINGSNQVFCFSVY